MPGLTANRKSRPFQSGGVAMSLGRGHEEVRAGLPYRYSASVLRGTGCTEIDAPKAREEDAHPQIELLLALS